MNCTPDTLDGFVGDAHEGAGRILPALHKHTDRVIGRMEWLSGLYLSGATTVGQRWWQR